MKRLVYALMLLAATACTMQQPKPTATDAVAAKPEDFVRISGTDLVRPNGEKLLIRGTNLGNWLNPEGYMFGFQKTSSAGRIGQMMCELVGPDKAAEFWQRFKDTYITREDVEFIAQTGANTIRLPFHYKLFTDEDYMGLPSAQDGFARVDSVVTWCRDNGLYLILDMHDAPGGQTGDNIDDSYGYPWLFESERSQRLFCDIWRDIAARYHNEPVILGYELMNEPIAHYFDNISRLNEELLPLYVRATKAIREVDTNHIILLGGAQWNSNFEPITDWQFDDKLMLTCHRYGGDATAEAIASFIEFRDRTGLPMYMGEIGHNTYEWQAAFREVMEANNIGWTYWPYKKLGDSCWMGIERPEGWDAVVAFAEGPRDSYGALREANPDREKAWRTLLGFIDNCRMERCVPQREYISSLGFESPTL